MSGSITSKATLFFDYLDSLGFVFTQNYQILRQKLVQADDKKLLMEVANYFQGISAADWFELTTQVYSTWQSKIDQKYDNNVLLKTLDKRVGHHNNNSGILPTPMKNDITKDFSSSNSSYATDSKKHNHPNDDSHLKRLSNSRDIPNRSPMKERIPNHASNISPARVLLSNPKLDYLASLFESLVVKRQLNAFYSIQYAAIESQRKATSATNNQPGKTLVGHTQKRASGSRGGTFDRSLKAQYQLLEEINKMVTASVKKLPQKIKTFASSKKPSEVEKTTPNKHRRSESINFATQNHSRSNIHQQSPESEQPRTHSRTMTPEPEPRKSSKVSFLFYDQQKGKDQLGVNWQGVKEYAALAEPHTRLNTSGGQSSSLKNDKDQFYGGKNEITSKKNKFKAVNNSVYQFEETDSSLQHTQQSMDQAFRKRSSSPNSLNSSYDKNAGSEAFHRLYRDADKKANNLTNLGAKSENRTRRNFRS